MPDDQPPDAGATTWDALRLAVRTSGLAVGLLHLPSRRFLELSPRAASLLGLELADLAGIDVLTLSQEPDATARALDLVAAGVLDGYRARRRLRSGEHSVIDSFLSVRVVVRDGDHTHAVATVTDPDDATVAGHRGDVALVVGMIDGSGRIENISSDSEPLLGGRSVEYLLTSVLDMVHPNDVAPVLTALEQATGTDTQVTVRVRVRDDTDAWQTLRLVVGGSATDSGRVGFALVPAEEETAATMLGGRVGELEERLRRIAREVEAAGVIQRFDCLPNPRDVPGLEDLTTRQWEILSRLIQGERVPAIARAVYLSQSTVRNHLATIFRKVGVHSQAELLERLRADARPTAPPDTR